MKKYIDLINDIDYKKLKEPVEIIKKGGIVVFPTETVYGIGANGLNKNAVKKLYEVKVNIEQVLVPLSIAYHAKYTSPIVKEFVNIFQTN